jgi:uncharacterized protein (DUF1800 family)
MNTVNVWKRLFAAGLTVAAAMTAFIPAAPGARAAENGRATAAPDEERRIVHVLNRLGYGPRPGDVARVRRMGLDEYVRRQLRPEEISDTASEARLASLSTLAMPISEMAAIDARARQLRRELAQRGAEAKGEDGKFDPSKVTPEMRREFRERYEKEFGDGKPNPRRFVTDLQQAKILRAAYSERQLQEVMTDFWFNHFNVYAGKGLDRVFLGAYEREAIRPHVLGKFEDLLRATAESSAMMFYLDNWQSVDPNAAAAFMNRRANPVGGAGELLMRRGRAPFLRPGQAGQPNPGGQPARPKRTPGINENYARELMELHTLGVDGGYTQKDVQEVARCFTGWSIHRPYAGLFGGQNALRRDDDGRQGRFAYNDWAHDKGEKVVLGMKIPSGGGKEDGDKVLRLLARHPSTARFIAAKLCRRFVSDAPPQTLIDAVARRFQDTDGDIREMMRAIVSSPQFFAPETYRAKVKTPLELVVSSLRATGAEIGDAQILVGVLNRMGMPLYGCQPPTGYPDDAERWVNAGALLARLNYGLALSGNKLPGVGVRPESAADGETEPTRAVNRLLDAYLHGDVSDLTRRTLLERASAPPPGTPAGREPSAMDVPAEPFDETEDLAEAAPSMRRPGKGERGRAGERAYDRSLADLARSGGPVTGVAQLTGLILGSPEFQRK